MFGLFIEKNIMYELFIDLNIIHELFIDINIMYGLFIDINVMQSNEWLFTDINIMLLVTFYTLSIHISYFHLDTLDMTIYFFVIHIFIIFFGVSMY